MIGFRVMYTKEKIYWRKGVGSFDKNGFTVLDFVARKGLPDQKNKNVNEIKKQTVQAGRRTFQYKPCDGHVLAG